MSSMLAGALGHAARNMAVLPLWWVEDGHCACGTANCRSAGKHPLTLHGHEDATTDTEAISGFWARWPKAGVGIRTGGNLTVLDVDPRNGGDASLSELERQFGPLPPTVVVETGGGGRHFYFRIPGDSGIRSIIGLRPGLDLKAAGGFVVAPPTLHVSGRPYRFLDNSIIPASFPSWLAGLVSGHLRKSAGSTLADRSAPLTTRLTEGERNRKLMRVAGGLRRSGADEETICIALLEVNRQRCDPPLENDEVRGIARSVMRYAPSAAQDTKGGALTAQSVRLRAEVSGDHGVKRPVLIHRLEPQELLLVDTANLVASKDRRELVSLLPDDVRDEARSLLEELAGKLAMRTNGFRPDTAQGRGIAIKDPELWPEAVDGEGLLGELQRTFLRFLVVTETEASGLALWTLHAHAHDAAEISPLLALVSPERRCGKTTALQILGALVPRPLMASNITPAALFRAVEKYQPTLLVDEADTFMKMNEELRGILNSGHSRRNAVVIRTVGDDHEPRAFRTWGPKVIALIGSLPPTLEDRAIVISMRRRSRSEEIEPLRLDRLIELEPLMRRAARWTRDNLEPLRACDPDVPAELHDRAADNLRPLLAVADIAGGDWPSRARGVAISLCCRGEEDETSRVQLLGDIGRTFATKAAERLSSKDLVWELTALEDRPWGEWRNGKPMTQPQLARMLKPFGVRPCMIRFGDETRRGYCLADFKDAFTRYLPSEAQQPKQESAAAPKNTSAKRNSPSSVPTDRNLNTPLRDCSVVGVSPHSEPPEPHSGGDVMGSHIGPPLRRPEMPADDSETGASTSEPSHD